MQIQFGEVRQILTVDNAKKKSVCLAAFFCIAIVAELTNVVLHTPLIFSNFDGKL